MSVYLKTLLDNLGLQKDHRVRTGPGSGLKTGGAEPSSLRLAPQLPGVSQASQFHQPSQLAWLTWAGNGMGSEESPLIGLSLHLQLGHFQGG